MFHKIRSVQAGDNFVLRVNYEDGSIKKYDMMPLITKNKNFALLGTLAFFRAATVDPSGYGIVWNDDIDIDGEEVYVNGIDVSPQERYDEKNTKQIGLKLNLRSDADIIALFESKENVQGYLKSLVREDMQRPGK